MQPVLAVAHRRLRSVKLTDIVPRHHRAGHPAGGVADRPGIAEHRQQGAVRAPDYQRLVHRDLTGARGACQRAVGRRQRNIVARPVDLPHIGLPQGALPGQFVRGASHKCHAPRADAVDMDVRPASDADPFGDVGEQGVERV